MLHTESPYLERALRNECEAFKLQGGKETDLDFKISSGPGIFASDLWFEWIHIAFEEVASKVCAACGGSKWATYPFCRSCSIKLHRMHMYRQLLESWNICGRPKYYDLCKSFLREYLKGLYQRKRNDDDGGE